MASSMKQRATKAKTKTKAKAKAKNTRPVHRVRAGRLSASIFLNRGDSGSFYSINPQRVYTDADGDTANATSFGESDLPTLRALLDEAWEFCRANPTDGDDEGDDGQEGADDEGDEDEGDEG